MQELKLEISHLKRQITELQKQLRAISPRTDVWLPPDTFVGDNCTIAPTVQFMSGEDREIRIGARTNIYRGTEITGPVTIGSGCLVNRDGYLRSNTTLGDNVMVGPFTRFVTDSHEIGPSSKRGGANKWPPIVVGDGTWIGASVTILGGVSIGKGCIIAAGAVVISDIPDNSLAGGVPARIIRKLNE
ncbi:MULTISPECIES: acyltransferase [Paenarthrobacter]|uniref:acyltransferase n=1 Tax=Paenarthrobacter TaxID=1742992 RepID=UPI0015BD3621|nr:MULTISPECIES: DapH/DapD/GlmU-related protein [Paenarthrobacter]WOC60194.1 DapH/DapD/GlmU-related protein [Paenarthrobacter sp. AT5]